MEDELSLRWRSHLQSQSGVVSREQAGAAGFTEKAIAWRLRSGKWQRIHRGVDATFTGKPSREGRLWAAVLCVGPDAVLSHETAAEIHGLTDKPSTGSTSAFPSSGIPDGIGTSGAWLYEEHGLCVELDGIAAHPAEGRWRDIHRDNANRAPGNADPALRLARRHRATLRDRRGNRRGSTAPRLDRHPAPLRPQLHRRPAARGGEERAGLREAGRSERAEGKWETDWEERTAGTRRSGQRAVWPIAWTARSLRAQTGQRSARRRTWPP